VILVQSGRGLTHGALPEELRDLFPQDE